MRMILAVAMSLPAFLQLSAQTMAQLVSVSDNTLYEDPAGSKSNGAGAHFFAGRTNQAGIGIRRGLLAFDVAGHIPAGAKIDSVTLLLHMSKTNALAGEHTISLHRVLADWGEGDSDAVFNEGGGADATPGDATWLHTFFDTSRWASPGGDFLEAASASRAVADTGFYTWGPTPEMAADVQSWLEQPEQNFGWLLRGNENAAPTARRFDTRENDIAAFRPVLRVYYSTATGVADTQAGAPADFALSPPFPNPIRASAGHSSGTSVFLNLVRPAVVSVRLYNMLGQEIATLTLQQPFAAGRHRFAWDGRTAAGQIAAPGMYFYRIQSAGRVVSRRVVVLP